MPASAYSAYAFEVLYARLNKVTPLSLARFKQFFQVTATKERYPLFVTWNIVNSSEKELRGCIGTFSPLDIEKGIKEYALIAAFDDSRFEPIPKEELPELSCDVTLLKDFEPADNIWDWEVGKHGIKISFKYGGHSRSATFLPDVAVEQGWDKKTTLKYLVQKAGGPRGVELDALNISLTRYKGEKSGLTYDEFIKIRKQLKE